MCQRYLHRGENTAINLSESGPLDSQFFKNLMVMSNFEDIDRKLYEIS
jgi:hypothetical protein